MENNCDNCTDGTSISYNTKVKHGLPTNSSLCCSYRRKKDVKILHRLCGMCGYVFREKHDCYVESEVFD